jgi:hypothetical protein
MGAARHGVPDGEGGIGRCRSAAREHPGHGKQAGAVPATARRNPVILVDLVMHWLLIVGVNGVKQGLAEVSEAIC